MNNVANAMRRHASQMAAAIQFFKAKTDLSEKERLETKAKVTASFIDAQAAWDAYRDHLIEHGFPLGTEQS